MTKKVFIIITLFACAIIGPLKASEDSLRLVNYSSDPYTFKVKQIVLPTALIAAASTTLFVDKVNSWDREVQSRLVDDDSFTHDDWFQYMPIATMWTLDLFGVESQHKFAEQTTTLAMAVVFNTAMVNAIKYTIKRKRPSGGGYTSFPSGHTATAFMSAEFLRMEYRDTSPWIGLSGYCFALATGYLRIYNSRHYLSDVMAGAGIGYLSVKMAYWLSPCVNRLIWGSDVRTKNRNRVKGSYNTVVPFTTGEQYGLSIAARF